MCSSLASPRALTCLGLLAVAAAGCGKKGDPLPPLSLVPRAAQDLAVGQRGTDLLLSVSYPSLTVSGASLPGLAALEVLRLVQPLPEGVEPTPPDRRQFVPAATEMREVSGSELEAATEGGKLHLRLAGAAQPGAAREAHTFAVRFVGKGEERSEPSNLVTLVPVSPPPAPRSLLVEPTAAGVEVSWAAEGEGVGGFRVYRRRAQERTYGPPLARLPAATTSYLDATARFGERYIYAVTTAAPTEGAAESAPRAEGAESAPQAEGAESAPQAKPAESASRAEGAESALVAEREVDYRDRFPPEAPAGVVALAEAARVRLSWQASAAPDLAGYLVWRRELPQGDPVRLTDEPLAAATFTATGLAPGTTYAFRVTAVDSSGNESPPSEEVRAVAQ